MLQHHQTPPTPAAYDFQLYTECGGTNTQIFRVPSGETFPNVLDFNSVCYESTSSTSTTSTQDITGLDSFNDCTACNAPTYDYRVYTQCNATATQVFRVESGVTFPDFIRYNNVCWGKPTSNRINVNNKRCHSAKVTQAVFCVAMIIENMQIVLQEEYPN